MSFVFDLMAYFAFCFFIVGLLFVASAKRREICVSSTEFADDDV
ncbi:hypothetical protein EC036_09100 [Enterobacter cloacae]|jgi:hypothetical protein|uniref:Uncharacterized protein n=1 Tax=Enterobacter cloacae subsp. cloacae (strain ATCC 13047 / DSM 30054 / NBRC 13535 / NCTC 10005 / WDCM 00083 / NCDC 279-56) TaxID=716541 RepID=A0A0H3CFL4_ENTCC|nr:hypothetical protein ECL_01103 [Enterobacter cloacae subsp. cloacae ATCC 13047]AIV28557.1 hypothetical protein EC036_09100 [Enterobacter cloacae]